MHHPTSFYFPTNCFYVLICILVIFVVTQMSSILIALCPSIAGKLVNKQHHPSLLYICTGTRAGAFNLIAVVYTK